MLCTAIESPSYTAKVPTERHIHELLKKENIPDKYRLIEVDMVSWFNDQNVSSLIQKMIDTFNEPDITNILISQHISSKYLTMPDNWLVFSPHATKDNNLKGLPHYSMIEADKFCHIAYRSNLFSFKGLSWSHPIREKLCELYPDSCEANSEWGVGVESYEEEYRRLLKSSVFTLCPLGTGPGSIRIFEALSYGSIPIIISDDLELPLSDIIDWNEFSIRISENNIEKIEDILLLYCELDRKKMQLMGQMYYKKYFSNNHLHKTVMEYLDNE